MVNQLDMIYFWNWIFVDVCARIEVNGVVCILSDGIISMSKTVCTFAITRIVNIPKPTKADLDKASDLPTSDRENLSRFNVIKTWLDSLSKRPFMKSILWNFNRINSRTLIEWQISFHLVLSLHSHNWLTRPMSTVGQKQKTSKNANKPLEMSWDIVEIVVPPAEFSRHFGFCLAPIYFSHVQTNVISWEFTVSKHLWPTPRSNAKAWQCEISQTLTHSSSSHRKAAKKINKSIW